MMQIDGGGRVDDTSTRSVRCGTLILDGMGKICGCGTAAGRLFGGNFADMAGKPISSLITDLEIGGAAHSYSARRLAWLCGGEDWRPFKAMDLRGNRFSVEISVAQMRSQDGIDMFLLSLRRPADS